MNNVSVVNMIFLIIIPECQSNQFNSCIFYMIKLKNK